MTNPCNSPEPDISLFPVGVLLDADTLGDDICLKGLVRQCRDWRSYSLTRADEVAERIRDAAVVVTNKVVLDRALLRQAPQLKLICVAATGTNNIDHQAAAELGIAVRNVTDYASASVAQHVFSLVLQLAGSSHRYRQDMQQGLWQRSPFFCCLDHPMMELDGKTFGIIGYGALGRATAKLAEAFGMRVICARRPYEIEDRSDVDGQGRAGLGRLLATADVVSLHCPLTEDTAGLISADALALMKPGALLINTARGGLVDEAALADALDSGLIGGAATDVLSCEPPVDGNVLLDKPRDNLIVTPHIAWATRAARQRLVDKVAANMAEFLADA